MNSSSTADFVLDSVSVSHTDTYTYLGTPISPLPISDQVKKHLSSKSSHVLKFYSFVTKNSDAPFQVKRTVWESALQSAIFYSSETWLTTDLRVAESTYMATLKLLLDVRPTTCNDIALVEAGVGKAKSIITQRQSNFLHKLKSRENFGNTYLGKVVDLAIESKFSAGQMLQKILDLGPNHDYVSNCLNSTKESVRLSNSSRRVAYNTVYPELSLNYIWRQVLTNHPNKH